MAKTANMPKTNVQESIAHIRATFRTEYPKTKGRRCSVGNLSPKLHDEYMDFCDKHHLGQAEALAALLDFAQQHEARYADELAALRTTTRV